MKKFLSISILLSVLFLYGCSNTDQVFERKQECGKLGEQMQKDIDTLRP